MHIIMHMINPAMAIVTACGSYATHAQHHANGQLACHKPKLICSHIVTMCTHTRSHTYTHVWITGLACVARAWCGSMRRALCVPHAAMTDVPFFVPVFFSRHSRIRSSLEPSSTSLCSTGQRGSMGCGRGRCGTSLHALHGTQFSRATGALSTADVGGRVCQHGINARRCAHDRLTHGIHLHARHILQLIGFIQDKVEANKGAAKKGRLECYGRGKGGRWHGEPWSRKGRAGSAGRERRVAIDSRRN